MFERRRKKTMADLAYRNEIPVVRRGRTDWGAIWAGVFAFMAVWAVFGSLGLAIFEAGAGPAMPITWGMGIWAIVLTAIAMYVAGRVTAYLAAVTSRRDGVVHGMVMFGLTVAALGVLAGLGRSSPALGTVQGHYLLAILGEFGWIGFLSLGFGWLCALWGSSATTSKRIQGNVQDIRSAA
jgi:hypothetical protein